ncbi:hypothetical protein E2C01_057479 [Portunus trituberculatus]|uniref:Uncharacterized protein n=1 Tax=Portunus trituberculatus TaxID=210409 RepID=A0A5B7GSZ6_PORTR|nr:hypothetical protein [Portunus trituberculatus]
MEANAFPAMGTPIAGNDTMVKQKAVGEAHDWEVATQHLTDHSHSRVTDWGLLQVIKVGRLKLNSPTTSSDGVRRRLATVVEASMWSPLVFSR